MKSETCRNQVFKGGVWVRRLEPFARRILDDQLNMERITVKTLLAVNLESDLRGGGKRLFFEEHSEYYYPLLEIRDSPF